MGLFGKPNARPPKDMVRDWSSKIRKEGFVLDRQVKSIQREEEKAKRSLKQAAKTGQKDVCAILAKEIVNSRKAVNKLHTAKARLKSVEYGMQQQLATLRVSGCLEKSTEVMKSMQDLINVPEVMGIARELSKEMMKAGIIEEMVEETMESLEDTDELEEEAQAEVDKVLYELTAGEIGRAPAAVSDSLPTGELEGATAGPSEEEEPDNEVEEMQARLEALRS